MILIIDNQKELLREYISKFSDFGLLSYGCSENEYDELLGKFDFDLFLIVNSSSLPSCLDTCRKLKETHPKIPLIMRANEESTEELDKFNNFADNIILPKTPFKKSVEIIMEYIRIFKGRSVTDMIHNSVRVELYGKSVFVYGSNFNATKVEYNILRYMVNSAKGVSIEELKTFCFNAEENVTEHRVIAAISRINQKSKALFSQKLICLADNHLYVIAI